ncbi:hypothetical protein TrRE_jg10906 [Triparma retinervis]|uniref:Uncharacterized protein n=1 Tax=Triparma retinervis TaxID=2557542 RepID=A0A9W7DTH7_9STRA|nr:hypothetical protein TrRE_jg10906 [Triparma retinervis]
MVEKVEVTREGREKQVDKSRLTPNSRNVDGLMLPLLPSLFVFGNSERPSIRRGCTSTSPTGIDDVDSDDESLSALLSDEVRSWSFLDRGIARASRNTGGGGRGIAVTMFDGGNRGPDGYHGDVPCLPGTYVEHIMKGRFQEGLALNVDGGKDGEVMDVEIGKVRIVTPGWLSRGDFAIVEMKCEGGEWAVDKVDFHNLHRL